MRLEKVANGCFAFSNESDKEDSNYDGISNARGF